MHCSGCVTDVEKSESDDVSVFVLSDCAVFIPHSNASGVDALHGAPEQNRLEFLMKNWLFKIIYCCALLSTFQLVVGQLSF